METTKKNTKKKSVQKKSERGKKSVGDQLMYLLEKKLSTLKIWNQPKRMDTRNGRDWVVRVVYEATIGDKKIECDWEGFATAKGAVQDLIKKVK